MSYRAQVLELIVLHLVAFALALVIGTIAIDNVKQISSLNHHTTIGKN